MRIFDFTPSSLFVYSRVIVSSSLNSNILKIQVCILVAMHAELFFIDLGQVGNETVEWTTEMEYLQNLCMQRQLQVFISHMECSGKVIPHECNSYVIPHAATAQQIETGLIFPPCMVGERTRPSCDGCVDKATQILTPRPHQFGGSPGFNTEVLWLHRFLLPNKQEVKYQTEPHPLWKIHDNMSFLGRDNTKSSARP